MKEEDIKAQTKAAIDSLLKLNAYLTCFLAKKYTLQIFSYL
jgi:hypothetical protein